MTAVNISCDTFQFSFVGSLFFLFEVYINQRMKQTENMHPRSIFEMGLKVNPKLKIKK